MARKKLLYASKKSMPPYLDQIIKISPKDLPISAYARMACQNCGLYGRGILCPPLLYQTYPQFKTIKSSIKYFNEFDYILVYVFKNDGTKRFWFKKDQRKFDHWRFRKSAAKRGRELKGLEKVSAKYLTRTMHKIRSANNIRGFYTETFIQGHCDMCGGLVCPNRENPPCKRKGMASMEATGINVYKLLADQNISYEYPVMSYLTQVTMMAVKEL